LWASGTPCSGPLALPAASARSAALADFSASSASMRAKALSVGCHCSMRASSALVTSTDETLRRRIAAARAFRFISAGSLIAPLPGAGAVLHHDETRRLGLERDREVFGRIARDRRRDGARNARRPILRKRHARRGGKRRDAVGRNVTPRSVSP